MDFAEEKRHVEAVIENAANLYQRDMRIRHQIDSCVAMAQQKFGRIDPEGKPDRDANDIATDACALMAARIYFEDAELHALRTERDQYKAMAERFANLTPQPIILSKQDA